MQEKSKQGLIITRHGEALSNIEKRIIGQQESPLTEKGIQQAHKTGKKLANTEIDYIISSPLSRAVITAEIIAKYSKPKKLAIASKLKPQSFGILEGHTIDEVIRIGLSQYLYTETSNKFTHYVRGGETIEKVMKRVFPVFQLLNKLAEDKNYTILLVLHNSVIRTIAGSVWELEPKKWTSLTVPNCEVFKILQEQPLSIQSIFLKEIAN